MQNGKLFISALLLLAYLALPAQISIDMNVPQDSNVVIGHLSNGLTYYIRHNEYPKNRAEFHIAQNVGAILEKDSQNGLAHFLEHMMFNGTEHFPGKGIINYFETIGVSFGSNINAYTALDETVYRLSNVPTVRTTIVDSALLVLHDWSHSALLEDDEIDAERGVIREEWRTRASASRRMWSKKNPQKFPGSQYAKRDVIGDTAIINNFPPDTLRAYYQKWYRPDQQAVIVVGDIDVKYVERQIRRYWSDVPKAKNYGIRPIYQIDDNKEPLFSVVRDKEANYTRIELDFKKKAQSKMLKNTVLYQLYDIMNTLACVMFNTRQSELSQDPESPMLGGGAYYTNLVKAHDAFIAITAAKAGQEKQAYRLLLEQLESMSRYGFTQSELDLAKSELLSQMQSAYNERQTRKNIQYTQEYIRNFLEGEPIPGIEWEYNFYKENLPTITLEMVNAVAKGFVTDENVILDFTAPEDENFILPDAEEAITVFKDRKNWDIARKEDEHINYTLVEKQPKAGKIKKTKHNKSLGTTEWTLSNGIKVVIKPTDFKNDEILVSAVSKGGLSLVKDPLDLPSADLATDIADRSGLGNLSKTDLQKAMMGKQAAIDIEINENIEEMSGWSTIKDFETCLQLMYLNFTAQRHDERAFEALIANLQTGLKQKDLVPKSVFSDTVSLLSTGNSERTILWNLNTVGKVEQAKAEQILKERFANPADFTFFFVGNINPNDKQTRNLICQWLGGLKTNKKAKENFIDHGVRPSKGIVHKEFDFPMQTKQTTNHIVYWNEMPYTLSNSLNMNLLGRVLSTRYLESIREREGGSYGVSCYGYCSKMPYEKAQLIMRFDTDPDKEAKVFPIIDEEVQTLLKDGPLLTDIQKEKEGMLKEFEVNMETNSYWLNYVLWMYYAYGIDYVKDYRSTIEALNAESVQQTLEQLLKNGNKYEVVMTPR